MTDAEKLRDLAEQLDGLEYLTCVGSGDLCRCVADEIELAYARIDSLLDSLLKANVALSENAGKVRELQDEIDRLRRLIRRWAAPRGSHRTCECSYCRQLIEVAENLQESEVKHGD